MLNSRSCIPAKDGKYQILKLLFPSTFHWSSVIDHFVEISLPGLLKLHPEKFIISIFIFKGLNTSVQMAVEILIMNDQLEAG